MKFADLAARLLGGSLGFQSHHDDSALVVARDAGVTPYTTVQTVTSWVCTTYTTTILALATGKLQ